MTSVLELLLAPRKIVLSLLLGLAFTLGLGCASLNPTPPIESFTTKLADEAIIPAVREGLSRGVESLSVQSGVQGINPTYVVEFEGKWVVGIEGRATVGAEGVSGLLQISATGPTKGTDASSPSVADRH